MLCGGDNGKLMQDESKDCKKLQNYIYNLGDKVGEGNFSQVFHGVDTNTGKSVAIKVIKYSSLTSKVAKQLLTNEAAIIRQLNHENVLKCLDIFSSKNNCYIITEFYEGGDLEKFLNKQKVLQEKDISRIVYEVYRGLLYLNQQGIVHRDFKLANIFLSETGSPKIADFGFAIKSNKPFKDINIGSPIYMSPEGMLLHEYGPKTEVWALGIVVYELLHGDTPLSICRSEKELREKIMLPPHFREGISPECRKFIDLCLTVDPKHRIQMKDLMQTQYMARLTHENERMRMSVPKNPNFKEDLFSTHHSSAIMALPQSANILHQFLRLIKNYDQGLAFLQYCRLIHKTVQFTPSSILSQWLLNICFALQKIKFQGGDRDRNEKLINTLSDYFIKYRKEHAPMHQINGYPTIEEVLKELQKLCAKASQLQSMAITPNAFSNRPFNNIQPNGSQLAIGHNFLSVLLKETDLLRKTLETNPAQLSNFVKCSQAEKFLDSTKHSGKNTTQQGGGFFSNFNK